MIRGRSMTRSGDGPPIVITPNRAMTKKSSSPGTNAVAHGLTAKKFLPAALAAAVADYRASLFNELAPQGPLAEILVSELARHAAAMQMSEKAEAAALRTAEANSSALAVLT